MVTFEINQLFLISGLLLPRKDLLNSRRQNKQESRHGKNKDSSSGSLSLEDVWVRCSVTECSLSRNKKQNKKPCSG